MSNEIILIKRNKIVFYNSENIINNKSINDASIMKNGETINNNETIDNGNLFKFSDIIL